MQRRATAKTSQVAAGPISLGLMNEIANETPPTKVFKGRALIELGAQKKRKHKEKNKIKLCFLLSLWAIAGIVFNYELIG